MLRVTEIPEDAPVILISGLLRKKGLVFFNERTCVLNSVGVFSYHNLIKREKAKHKINLK